MRILTTAVLASVLLAPTLSASAQTAAGPAPVPATGTPVASTDSEGVPFAGKMVLLFPSGGDALDAQNQTLLDKASRVYREGRPIIMVVSGSSDSVGEPTSNLLLSQRRANAVARGLLARGIPAERTQILAKGETNPAVTTPKGTAEAQNRRVEIAWR